MGLVILGIDARDVVTDGTLPKGRLGDEAQLIISDARARYTEAAQRGQVFSVTNPLTGVTLAAGNVAPPAAGAAVLLGLLNPVGSKVNLELLRCSLAHISGTPGAGIWTYCMARQLRVTAAGNVVARNHTGHKTTPIARAFSSSAVTGGVAFQLVRRFPSTQFAALLAATAADRIVSDEVAGEIVVPPGYMVVLAPPATGTTHVVAAGMTWAEVPTSQAGVGGGL